MPIIIEGVETTTLAIAAGLAGLTVAILLSLLFRRGFLSLILNVILGFAGAVLAIFAFSVLGYGEAIGSTVGVANQMANLYVNGLVGAFIFILIVNLSRS